MTDPYASHLPILRMVLGLVKPKRVLELGAGNYSTPCFLECPTVERLVTLETDPEWVPAVDPKLTLHIVEDAAEELPDLRSYDLVFVDNADNAADRERAIRAVLTQPHPPTVIHDADYPSYRKAITDLAENHWIFTDYFPHTAVAW